MTLSVRESIIATLKDNPGDWFSAREIFDAIEHIDAGTPHRVGNILKIMHQEGLVARQAKGNSNLWCVSPHEPEVPSNGASNPVVKPFLQPPNHPWKEKACQPSSPRTQPIACELPVHLLTPKPSLEERCPSSLIQECEEAMEDDSAALGLPEIIDTHESIEDEPYPPLTQFLIHEAEERERVLQGNEAINERHCTGQCQSKTQLTHADARDDYLRLLITIADDAAVNGEQLKDWPIWTKARALAPHFNLEASYA